MTTAAKAFGQRNAVEIRARTQAHLHALGAGVPHQRKAAALAREDIAHLAVEHAGAVDHQTLHAVEREHLRTAGNVLAQALELLIHRTAARHEGGFLLRRESGNFGPALKGAHFHVQRSQEGRALGKLPLPDVTVFDVLDQAGHGLFGVEKLPAQTRTRLVHVKVHHAALALVARQLLGRALVVVQHHQLADLGFNLGHQHGLKRKVHHVHRTAFQVFTQIRCGLDFTVVQPAVFGLVTVEQPRRHGSAKTIGTAATVVEDEGTHVLQRRLHKQLQGQNGVFHVAYIVAACAQLCISSLQDDTHLAEIPHTALCGLPAPWGDCISTKEPGHARLVAASGTHRSGRVF